MTKCPDPSNEQDKQHIESWLAYLAAKYNRGSVSLYLKRRYVYYLCNYLESRGRELKTADTAIIRDYLDKLNADGYRPKTIEQRAVHIRGLFRYLHLMGIIKEEVYPSMLRPIDGKANAYAKEGVVLDFNSIVKMRAKLQSARLVIATAFEVYLTSGLRLAELTQLRLGDLEFGSKVPDNESGMPSKYVGGKFTLSTSRQTIKKRKGRDVYFSVLAAKLLRSYIAQNGINHPRLPLFPYGKSTIQHWIAALGENVIDNSHANEPQRQPGFADLIEAELSEMPEVSEQFKNRIRRRQAYERLDSMDVNKYLKQEDYIAKPQNKLMNVHALRKTFSCLMYYRSYFGTYRDLAAVKTLLGHAKIETINVYLLSAIIMQSRLQWEYVMLGRPGEYRAII